MARQWFYSGDKGWELCDFGDFAADLTGNPFFEVGAWLRSLRPAWRDMWREIAREVTP